MSYVNQLSQNAIPNDSDLRFQNVTLNVGRSEPVTNCDRFNSAVNWKSHHVISNENILRSQFATASGYGAI